MELNKELALEAKRNGICTEWFNRLQKTTDKGELVKMYLEGIDFCLSNDYPSRAYIKEHFVGFCEKYGVFLDEAIDTENFRHVVALGTSSGTTRYMGFEVGQVFAKHDSSVEIEASGNSFVMVDVFDDSSVKVRTFDNAKVCVNRYGGHVEAENTGNSVIKVINKKKSNY